MIPSGHPSGDLQIYDAIAQPVPAHAFSHDDRQRGLRHRHRDAKLIKRTLEPRQMTPLVDDVSVPDFADLVDAV
jgi:hypothetical protein